MWYSCHLFFFCACPGCLVCERLLYVSYVWAHSLASTSLLELEVTPCCGVRLCSTDVRWQRIRAAYYCLHVRNVRIIFYSMSIIIAISGNLQQLFIVPEYVIGNVHYIVCCGRCFGSEFFAVLGSSPIFAVSTNLRIPRPMASGCTMRVMFYEELSPFVDLFCGDWPMDVNQTMVLRAISQCTSLDNHMKTLAQQDPARGFIYRWLYPSVPHGYTGWQCISPLNRLNYVLLSMKSRYAAMAATAMIPSLYQDPTPHAMAGIVLQGFLEHVQTYGAITWKHFVNIGNLPLPRGRPSILQIMCWINNARHRDSPETIFLWCRDFTSEAPPQKFPYAMH